MGGGWETVRCPALCACGGGVRAPVGKNKGSTPTFREELRGERRGTERKGRVERGREIGKRPRRRGGGERRGEESSVSPGALGSLVAGCCAVAVVA